MELIKGDLMKFLKLGLGLVTTILIFLFLSAIPIVLLCLDDILFGILIFILYYIANVFFLVDAYSNKRSDKQSKVSWTIVLLLPLASFFLYIVTSKLFSFHKKHNHDIKEYEMQLFEQSNRKYFLNPDTNFDILIGGEQKFPKLIEDLKSAKEEILIEYFILNEGIIWKQIESILIDKANEGIKVKIITDFAGNIQNKDETYNLVRNHPNIEFFIYNKIAMPFTTGYSNLRSHNKIVIVDKKIGYFGGFNIGDDYSSAYSKYGYWYDVHFRSTNELVLEDLYKQYELDWFRITKKKSTNLPTYKNKISDQEKSNFISMLDGYYSDEPMFLNSLIDKVNAAKSQIKMVSPYLIIPDSLLEALINASKRQVKIEIITTGRADKKSAYYASRYYSDKLTNHGIKVYRTNNFFLHAKYYVIDEKTNIFGTSNIDSRSFYLHYEYNFIFESTPFANKIIDQSWNDLIKMSTLLGYEKKVLPNWIIRLISQVL